MAFPRRAGILWPAAPAGYAFAQSPHHRNLGRPGPAARQATGRALRRVRRRPHAVGRRAAKHPRPHAGSAQEALPQHPAHRAARRRGAPGVRPPLPLALGGAPRGQRQRHPPPARAMRRVRDRPRGGVVEQLRLRRAARQSPLHARGQSAQRLAHVSRDARPRRGRRPGRRVRLAVPQHRDLGAEAGQHARLLRALGDRHLPQARHPADGDRLRPDDAVHPRGRLERGDRARAREAPARRLQRHRPRRSAAQGRDSRDRAQLHLGARADHRLPDPPAVSLQGVSLPRVAPSTSSSIPVRCPASASCARPASSRCFRSRISSRAWPSSMGGK